MNKKKRIKRECRGKSRGKHKQDKMEHQKCLGSLPEVQNKAHMSPRNSTATNSLKAHEAAVRAARLLPTSAVAKFSELKQCPPANQ